MPSSLRQMWVTMQRARRSVAGLSGGARARSTNKQDASSDNRKPESRYTILATHAEWLRLVARTTST
jgi:hypothetical protein